MVRQGVGRGSRDWGQGTAINSAAYTLSKIGGKEALVVWDFLEMLPLSELSNGIEATLTVKVVVDRFIHGYTGSRWDISLDVGEQPPLTMGSFYSERVIIQTGTQGSYSGQDSVSYGDKRVMSILNWDFSCVALSVLS